MASAQPQSRRNFPCFKCHDNGFDKVMVYLAGKDQQGKTIQLEADGTRHIHKTKEEQQQQQHHQFEQQQQQQEQDSSTTTIAVTMDSMAVKIINTKLDRVIALLESQEEKPAIQQK